LYKFFLYLFIFYASIFGANAVSVYGKPDFSKLNYINQNAPKGGTFKQGVYGYFDSLNPFILKGESVDGIEKIHDSLLFQNPNEPFSFYGLIAKDINISNNFKTAIFTLRPEAKFSDNSQITAFDVNFTFNILKTKGHPFYRQYLASIENIEILSPEKIKIDLTQNSSRDMILNIGTISILSSNFWKNRDFEKESLTDLEPVEIIGNGAYLVDSFKVGKYLKLKINPNYWGKNLNINRGRNNFEFLKYDYYRDENVLFEAFKSKNYDFRHENIAKNWATGYNGNYFDSGEIITKKIKNSIPQGMQGFFFNTRNPIFKDRRIRKAIFLAFDFEWLNKNIFYNQYTRTNSFFANSIFASSGKPNREELEILQDFNQTFLPKNLFNEFKIKKINNYFDLRKNLRKAMRLIKSTGEWHLVNGKMRHKTTNQQLKFEILLASKGFVRVVLPFKKNLARLGIDLNIRLVEPSVYIRKIQDFKFDMVVSLIRSSTVIGNELFNRFHSKSANISGSQNLAGIQNLIVDNLIEKIVQTQDLEQLKNRVYVLDRVLLNEFYVIPHWYLSYFRIGYSSDFEFKKMPEYNLDLDSWWRKK
jgi:microcin C transport system substrate-binding protein